jgi:hypothetical protein
LRPCRNWSIKIRTLIWYCWIYTCRVSAVLLNKQIAYDMGISEATIKAHVTAIMTKLGVSNHTQAVLAASKLNVLKPELLD